MGQLDPLTRFKIKYNLPVGKGEAHHMFTRISQARQASNALHPLDRNHNAASSAEATPKARRVLDDVAAHLAADPKHKAIIYTNLVHGGVEQMVAGLRHRGHEPGLFIGSKHQKKTDRAQHVADYLEGRKRVMVINQAGTEGINLPGTTAHFTLDPHFNPMTTMQAEARGIRAGSPVKAVDVYRYRSIARKPAGFLPRENSTDQWVQGVADKKDDLNKQFLDLMR
jgi:ERCC4-related helicase